MDENILYDLNCDSKGNTLTGERNYLFLLPEGMPSCKFWSVIVYDSPSGFMIKTDQSWPSVYSSCKNLLVNQDGTIEIRFGPTAPSGKESNWIKTIPGKEWSMILRLYEPAESSLDGVWRPGKIEEIG